MKDPEYEKEKVSEVIITKHTITIPLNATRDKILEVLCKVPKDAKVSMVVSDHDAGFFGKIVFTEEKNIN